MAHVCRKAVRARARVEKTHPWTSVAIQVMTVNFGTKTVTSMIHAIQRPLIFDRIGSCPEALHVVWGKFLSRASQRCPVIHKAHRQARVGVKN